jgi:hypothetical protein
MTSPGTRLRWRIWLTLLGAPVLWLVHFLLAYLYSEAACNVGGLSRVDRIVLPLAGILFALGTLVITFFTLRIRDQARLEGTDVLLEIGFLMGLLFTFVLLIETLGVFFIERCF